MRITIEADMDEEKDIETAVYENVWEFAIVGTMVESRLLPKPFSRAHGDPIVLIGKIAELRERLRRNGS